MEINRVLSGADYSRKVAAVFRKLKNPLDSSGQAGSGSVKYLLKCGIILINDPVLIAPSIETFSAPSCEE